MDNSYKILNIDKILDEYDNDLETVQEIIKVFLQYYPEQLKLLTNAISENNAQQIGQFAHKLKGSVGNFYIESIIIELEKLEKMGKIYTNDLQSKAQTIISQVTKNFEILNNDLQIIINKKEK